MRAWGGQASSAGDRTQMYTQWLYACAPTVRRFYHVGELGGTPSDTSESVKQFSRVYGCSKRERKAHNLLNPVAVRTLSRTRSRS